MVEKNISEGDLLESLLNNIPDFVYFKDKNARYVKVSKYLADTLGFSNDELSGKKTTDLYPDEWGKRMHRSDLKVINNERKVVGKEEKVNLPNGEVRWMSTTKVPRYDDNGNVIGVLGISRDITERKEMEKEIIGLNEFHNALIENVNVILEFHDDLGNIIIWNKAAEEITGYSKEEVVGDNEVWDWLYPDKEYRKEIFDNIAEIAKGGKAMKEYESILRCKNGERRTVSWNSKVMKDEDSNVIGTISLGRDITERKKSERREDFLNYLVQGSLRDKFHIIENYMNFLKKENLSDKGQKYLENAIERIDNCIGTVKNARLLREVKETESDEIDVRTVITSAVENNRVSASKSEMDIHYEDFESEKIIGGRLLEKTFSNIIENSIQHSFGSNIRISGESLENEFLVKIGDDGKGISNKNKGDVFEIGFRREGSPGPGLGLPLAKEIVEEYGGCISIEDSKLGGAKFNVYLVKS